VLLAPGLADPFEDVEESDAGETDGESSWLDLIEVALDLVRTVASGRSCASATYKDISNNLIRLTTGSKTNETADLTEQDDKGDCADPSCEDRSTDKFELFPIVSIDLSSSLKCANVPGNRASEDRRQGRKFQP